VLRFLVPKARVPGQTHTTMLRASRKVAQGHTCRESRACRISTRRWGVAGADPLGTLSSGLGRQNHQSALMRCHQHHFPWSAVMMARVAWKRVDPDALLPIRRLVRRLIPPPLSRRRLDAACPRSRCQTSAMRKVLLTLWTRTRKITRSWQTRPRVDASWSYPHRQTPPRLWAALPRGSCRCKRG